MKSIAMALSDVKNKVHEEFITLRTLNSELVNNLTEYAEGKGCWDDILMQGVSFKQAVDLLNQVKSQALTDENYSLIFKVSSPEMLDGVSQNLNIQIRHHKEVKHFFEYVISQN